MRLHQANHVLRPEPETPPNTDRGQLALGVQLVDDCTSYVKIRGHLVRIQQWAVRVDRFLVVEQASSCHE
jgi:hypothetical protein